jgi:hypothetical protein
MRPFIVLTSSAYTVRGGFFIIAHLKILYYAYKIKKFVYKGDYWLCCKNGDDSVKWSSILNKEIAKCIVLCANCHTKEHYEWARRNKEPFREGLAGQFLAVEQELSTSQEEEFAHAAENQYVPDEVDISVYDDSAGEL